MKFEAFGRPKSREELEKQAKLAEGVLGKEMYPPDKSLDVLDIANASTIQEKYKTRYDAYIASLRAIRRGELDSKEIQHAKEWITALNNLDTYIKDHESKDNPLLREKQFIVFKKIRDFLEEGKRKGYIKLPTGTGKTILFSKITEALNMKTLIASPSKIILHQNAEETEEFTDSEFGKYYESEKDLSKKVTHITYNSLVNAVRDEKINPDDIPVLILDEVHRSLGPERAQTVKKFSGLQLGFTATSEFSEDKKVSNLLEEEIFRMDVAEGIREGLICQTQTIHAYTNVDLSSVDTKSGQYNQEQLEKVINVQGRNVAALELYEKRFGQLKVICNCSGVYHAQDVAKLFNEKGVRTACITGDTPKAERIKILNDYKNGDIKVLTNAKVLLEGFNEPSCSATFNLHPTLSLVDAEQRARSGRLDKNNPDKWSYVVDFIDQNSREPQVLYSEILRADRVWDISAPQIIEPGKEPIDKPISEPRPPINFDDFSMEGLRVVVDTRNIMEITNMNLNSREDKEKREWTFTTLQEDVRAKSIETSKDYENNVPKNKWLSRNILTSMLEFPKNPDGSNDWYTFLGKEKWTFTTLQADVRAKGIKSSGDYSDNAPKNNWPAVNTVTSMPEFPKNPDGSRDWDLFFGREKFDLEKFRADVRAKGIKSSGDYAKNYSKHKWLEPAALTSKPEFPKNPDGSNDWGTFLGREIFDFEKLRAEVRKKGITSSKDYEKNAPKYRWLNRKLLASKLEFPKKSDGSNDWGTFLGREDWTFETLRADVRAKHITSSKVYRDNESRNKWPIHTTLTSMPEFPKKSDGTNDWDTFLGKEKKKEWTFETLQADVRVKDIKSSKDYRNKTKQNKWPSQETLATMNQFPKNPDGSNDWDTFLGKEKIKFDFEAFRREVIAKRIISSEGYIKQRKQNNWPIYRTLVDMPEFPKNPDGSNDWGTFLGRENK